MGQTATADLSTTTSTEEPPAQCEPLPTEGFDSDDAGSTDDNEHAAFPSVVARWQLAQNQVIKALRDWTIANWGDLIDKTGGRGLPEPAPGIVMDLITGTLGNFLTDSPLKLFEVLATEAGMVSGPEGALAGLVLSSVIATVVEMCGNAITGATNEATTAFSAGAEAGADLLRAFVVEALHKADTAEAMVNRDAITVASKGATACGTQVKSARLQLEHTSHELEIKARAKVNDRSLYEHLLHEWVQLHMVAPEEDPSSVDPERFDGAVEEVGGREKLDAEAPHREPETITFGPGDEREISTVQHQFDAARIMLEGAGLNPDLAMVLLGRGPGSFDVLLSVANVDAYRAFIDQHWPGERKVDPTASDSAAVTIAVTGGLEAEYLKSIEFDPHLGGQSIGDTVTLVP